MGSDSTALLGLTFSELLKRSDAPEDLFNALQRSDQNYQHCAQTSASPRQSQHMVLSEINESDSSPRHRAVDEHPQEPEPEQEQEQEPRASPYKSLAMETDIVSNA